MVLPQTGCKARTSVAPSFGIADGRPDVCSRDFLLLALPSGQLVTGRVTAPARIAAD
jgi:hypothetical protein